MIQSKNEYCVIVGIWEQQVTLYTCGYLQMSSNLWMLSHRKGKALFCISDSSFWFTGEEMELVSGISLCPRFEGAEGLY